MLLPWIYLLQAQDPNPVYVYSSKIITDTDVHNCNKINLALARCSSIADSVTIQGETYNLTKYTPHHGTDYDVINLDDDNDVAEWTFDTDALKRLLIDETQSKGETVKATVHFQALGTSVGPPQLNTTHYVAKRNPVLGTEDVDPIKDDNSCTGWSRLYANQQRSDYTSQNHLWLVCYNGIDNNGVTVFHRIENQTGWEKVYQEPRVPSTIGTEYEKYSEALGRPSVLWVDANIFLETKICDEAIKFGEAADNFFVIQWTSLFSVTDYIQPPTGSERYNTRKVEVDTLLFFKYDESTGNIEMHMFDDFPYGRLAQFNAVRWFLGRCPHPISIEDAINSDWQHFFPVNGSGYNMTSYEPDTNHEFQCASQGKGLFNYLDHFNYFGYLDDSNTNWGNLYDSNTIWSNVYLRRISLSILFKSERSYFLKSEGDKFSRNFQVGLTEQQFKEVDVFNDDFLGHIPATCFYEYPGTYTGPQKYVCMITRCFLVYGTTGACYENRFDLLNQDFVNDNATLPVKTFFMRFPEEQQLIYTNIPLGGFVSWLTQFTFTWGYPAITYPLSVDYASNNQFETIITFTSPFDRVQVTDDGGKDNTFSIYSGFIGETDPGSRHMAYYFGSYRASYELYIPFKAQVRQVCNKTINTLF
jgi:hypothetical protein